MVGEKPNNLAMSRPKGTMSITNRLVSMTGFFRYLFTALPKLFSCLYM
ncbi:hypothetical protein HG1285_14119 [Hydrogenivirga sp. 128-5-R1-1]|nr:hypothetical protein HG1285_14119 [Hydrogenivirga sp. 128-5-R1-1]